MNSKFIPEHYLAIKPQNLGPWLMKSSQSNFNLQSPGSYLARSYLIATVHKCNLSTGFKEGLNNFSRSVHDMVK